MATAASALGVDGKYYAPYGIVPSAMAVPFYVVGAGASRTAPPQFAEFIKRWFVCLLDPTVSAATCVIVFLFARRLRYPQIVALLVTLAFGLATITWPYSKHYHSEPVTGFWLVLSTYATIVGVRNRSVWWLLLAGCALGLSVGSKVSTAIVLPAVLLYVFAHGWESRSWPVRSGVRRSLFFCSGLAIPTAIILLANYLRFGELFQTGYQEVASPSAAIQLLNLHGIAGLLFSPGKSVFVYSPVVVLTPVGLCVLWSRFRHEAVLFGLIVASHVVLYGQLTFWHGDAAWGPRYLDPVTAFLVLPVGAILAWVKLPKARRAAWQLFALFFSVGVVIQLGGILFNYDTYTVATGGTFGPQAQERRWKPAMTPVIAHWDWLFGRLQELRRWQPPDAYLESGFYQAEGPPGAQFPRWTTGDAVIDIPFTNSSTVTFTLRYIDSRPPQAGPTRLSISASGPRVVQSSVGITGANGQWSAVGDVHLSSANSGPVRISIVTNTWIPANFGPSSDQRHLGISVRDVQLVDGIHVTSVAAPYVPQLPVTTSQPWSRRAWAWFYGEPHQVLDLWMWYLYFSGLPRYLLILALLPSIALVLSARLLSLWLLSFRSTAKCRGKAATEPAVLASQLGAPRG